MFNHVVANPNTSKLKVDKRVRSSDQQNRSLHTQSSTNYTTNARADSDATKLVNYDKITKFRNLQGATHFRYALVPRFIFYLVNKTVFTLKI